MAPKAETKGAGKVTKSKKGGTMSPYNKFMKDNVMVVKAANPELTHREAFKKVAVMWATAPENPKNKK